MPPASQIHKVISSPLASTLVALLFFLAIVEAAFISVLALDVLEADRTAREELKLLQVTEAVSNTIYAGKELRTITCRIWEQPGAKNWQEAYVKTHKTVQERLFGLKEIYKNAGLSPQLVEPSIESLEKMHKETENLLSTSERSPEYQKIYEETWFDVFRTCLHDLRYLHSLFPNKHTSTPLLGLTPKELLLAFSACNFSGLLLIIMLIDRRITSPISALAHDCQRIERAELMPKPQKVRDEVGQLQESFYEMSKKIAENERLRQNFLNILQDVQIGTLKQVHADLVPVSQLEALTEKAKKRSRALLETLLSLVQLLNWMADALKSSNADHIEPIYQLTQSSHMAENAVAAVESLLLKKRIAVQQNIESFVIYADPQLLNRVLVNLMSNAIKFSEEGATISISCQHSADSAIFSVQDFGPGIPDSERHKLFKRFSMLPSPDGQKRHGTGLGLSICKQIVEAHGGQISCSSIISKGSTFTFTIPIENKQAAENHEEKSGHNQEQINNNNNNRFTAATQSPPSGWSREARSRRSIKTVFTLLVGLFIAIQSTLSLMLYSRFTEASERSETYAGKKAVLLHTQEYLAMFLVWTRMLEQSVKEMNVDSSPAEIFNAAMRLIRPLKDRIKQAKWVVENLPPESMVSKEMHAIWQRDEKVLKLIQFGVRSGPGLNPAMLETIKTRITSALEFTDSRLFQVIALENEDLNKAFDWSAKLRQEILVTLSAAAVLNLILIFASALLGLSIIKNIAILSDKAGKFADGAALEESVKGENELALLDKSICRVSEALKEAEARRQSILAVISHDLATPLASILTGIEILTQGLYQSMPEKELSALAQSDRKLSSLLRQIYDLLLIEKIESGTVNVNIESLALDKLIENALSKIAAEAEDKNLDLDFDESSAIGIEIQADKTLCARLLEIVCRNALKASPNNGKIAISVKPGENGVEILVINSGPMIDPKLQSQIFERFRYIDGKPITGLGLPLAHKICRVQNCHINMESTEFCTKAVISFSHNN